MRFVFMLKFHPLSEMKKPLAVLLALAIPGDAL